MGNLPLNLITFPLWWYSTGVRLMLDWNKRQFKFSLHQTGLLLFVRHLREPLYSDYTRSGIIIGAVLRVVILLFKLLLLAVRLLLLLIVDIFYASVLPACLANIILQIVAK